MNHKWLKPLILFGVFIFSILVFECRIYTGGAQLTNELKEPTLPMVFLSENNRQVNHLRGYVKEMEPQYIRNTITPLYGNLELPIKVLSYEKKITEISYEVRSLDASRLIEDNKVANFKAKKGKIQVVLPIQNILDEGTEYLLTIKLHSKEETISYYTRIIKADSWNISKCVDFAMDFHEKSLNKETANELATYMETTQNSDKTTLQQVSIKSSLRQVSWGDFAGKKQTEPRIQIVEATPTYSVILLDYVMSFAGEKGELEYYNIQESYRVRITDKVTYLLDYDRTMNQIFRGESGNFKEDKMLLGIRDENVDFMTNEHGTNLCFVQQGELWAYNQNNESLAKIFSFRGFEGIDERGNSKEHNLRILKVNETGSTDFVVYGYMSRGTHEGTVGVCVYHYDSVSNTLEEELWIPFTKSFEVIEDEVGKVTYVNKGNQFFIMVEGTIYKIDLETRKKTILASGVGENWYAFSQNNSRIAWISKGDENTGTEITVYDMEKENSFIIKAKEDEYIRPGGFLRSDLIYGMAKKSQVLNDGAGNIVFPMYKLSIINRENKEIKSYDKPGYFVTDVTIKDYTIYLKRIQEKDGAYVEAVQDTIMNQAGDKIYPVVVEKFVSPIKQSQIRLVLLKAAKEGDPKILTPKLVKIPDNRSISLEKKDPPIKYYAYAKGQVVLSTLDSSEAISAADEQSGVVIDSQMRYVWKRARDSYQETLPGMVADLSKVGTDYRERCLSIMLKQEGINISVSELLTSGKTPKEILESSLQTETVLDLNGCNLQQILYYVNQTTPVFGMISVDKAVLIVGFSSSSYVIYDPQLNAARTVAKVELETAFENAGNVFLAYLRK